MKKFVILVKNEAGAYEEQMYFLENSKELKDFPGFTKILNTERVSHPAPEVMQRVLLGYQLNKRLMNLSEFYRECAEVEAAFAEDERKKLAELATKDPAKHAEILKKNADAEKERERKRKEAADKRATAKVKK